MRSIARLACVVVIAGLGLAGATLLLTPQIRDFFTAGRVPEELVDLQPLATRSVVYARDGSVLYTFHAEENRVPVPLDKVPAHLVQAVIDAEDERYWDHGPIDLRAITRALVANVGGGGVFEGGSTITQQLVKTSLLNPRQDVNRKVQEAALAIRLERQMSKSEILERYLNTVYFGNGVYGVQAAAEKYFGTNVTEVTLPQAVLLAGLIRNPVGSDPWVYPEEATDRRALVVDRMHHLAHVTDEQLKAVKVEPLPPPPPERPAQGSDYFVEHVRKVLLADERLGATEQDRIQALFRGGLAIHTTLDPNMQRLAEEKVDTIVPDTGGRFTASLVSVEPQTGAVRALVGGRGFDQSKFNLGTQGARQTGSSFKMFTLLAALEAGYLPADTISGVAPCSIPNPGGTPDPWIPRNVEGQGGGTISLTEATVGSVNCAYARLIKLVGPQKVVEVANRMGITTELPAVLSLTLGSKDITPLEMASAYATLAADGERRPVVFIDRVEDRSGKVLLKSEGKPERAISAQHARTANQVLTQVVTRGTGTAALVPGWSGAIGGKTGSTDNNYDAWFVGYTQGLSTAVWMGSPERQVEMSNVGGIRVYGGTYPAMIWGSYMRALLANQPVTRFAAPDAQITRQGRPLALAGERIIDPESTTTTNPNQAQDPNATVTTGRDRDRTIDTLPDGFPNVTNPAFTIPDTTRPTRPPRPRDLTTTSLK